MVETIGCTADRKDGGAFNLEKGLLIHRLSLPSRNRVPG
jgi:hypothetical protein